MLKLKLKKKAKFKLIMNNHLYCNKLLSTNKKRLNKNLFSHNNLIKQKINRLMNNKIINKMNRIKYKQKLKNKN